MTLEEIEKKIASVCRDEPAILAAYLFGSFARGRAGKSSDLDVALLLDKGAEARFSLLAFMVAVEKKIGLNADVVILNHAGEEK